ncbi:hypothetical protein [Geodermatophilus chilensis]|uniref:hypothetical protein n=1 Tax=Geodermatophilus chilensis TaxID=2035835 RepID=UPI000C25C0AC|nr:hypothetical protein [Geodermatophilus chilensis]
MGLLDYFRSPEPVTEASVPLAEHAALANQLEVVQESLAGLEQLAREDAGWRKLGMEQAQSFTRAGLLTIHSTCLAAYVKSPLIGRGLRIRRNYVWGRGCEVAARDADVNELLQAFLDSPDYQRTLGSAQAREERETDLGVRGEFFVLAVHDPAARTVRPRMVPAAQIVDSIANPNDSTDVWLYKRQWTATVTDLRFVGPDGRVAAPQRVTRTEWHPTLEYRPALRERVMLIGTEPVRWDQPIQHCAVNAVTDAPWGIPDTYAALDWARGYADYLSSWAGLMKSLARYAYKATAPAKHAPRVRAALQQGRGTNPVTGEATDPVGATALMSPDAAMAPMHSSGATINADSGKPLAGMAAAALDVPLTMLLADPGTTGARAVAETLDRPLQLTTGSRQQLWTDWLKALFAHVLLVAAEDQVLPGDVEQVGPARQALTLTGDADATVDVTFPPVEDMPLKDRLEALGLADDLGTVPPLILVRLALEALGVEDVDEVLDDLTDDDGDFIDPRVAASVAAVQRERNGAPGSQAAEAYR